MSVLRYNVVSDQRPFRAREAHLKRFFTNVRKGVQPIDPKEDSSTLISTKAACDGGCGAKPQKRKYNKKPVKKSSGEDDSDSDKGSKKKKAKVVEDNIKKHKFSSANSR